MNYLKQITDELREKRLWPLAALLLAALVAVPVLLSTSSSAPAVTSPQTVANAGNGVDVPVVSAQSGGVHSKLSGRGRNPFVQQPLPAAPSSGTTGSGTTSGGGGSSSAAARTGGGTGTSGAAVSAGASTSGASGRGSTGSGSTGSGSTDSGSTGPSGGASGAPGYMRYETTIKTGSSSTQLKQSSDVERYAPLPTSQHPLLLFLGARTDRKTAVFLVANSATVTGQGQCVPNHFHCTYLNLTAGQKELVLYRTPSGGIGQYLLQVTGIKAARMSSASAAAARISSVGRALLQGASKYNPALRSLTYSSSGLLSITER